MTAIIAETSYKNKTLPKYTPEYFLKTYLSTGERIKLYLIDNYIGHELARDNI